MRIGGVGGRWGWYGDVGGWEMEGGLGCCGEGKSGDVYVRRGGNYIWLQLDWIEFNKAWTENNN